MDTYIYIDIYMYFCVVVVIEVADEGKDGTSAEEKNHQCHKESK